MIEHGDSPWRVRQFTWRPSNSRTIRSVCAAFCWSCVTITTVVLSSRFRVLRMATISSPICELPVGSSASRDARPADDRPGDGDALLLAARELRGKWWMRALSPTRSSARPASAAPRSTSGDRAAESARCRAREVADQVEHLEDEADFLVAHRGQGAVRIAGDGRAVDLHGPPGRLVEQPHQVEQRALPAARRPHDRNEFTLMVRFTSASATVSMRSVR